MTTTPTPTPTPRALHRWPRWILALAVLTLGLLPGGCGEPTGSDPRVQAPEETVFRFVIADAVKTLNPQGTSWMSDFRVIDTIFEPLLAVSPQTLEVEPGAAESFTVSPDGRVYTFVIRDDALWSNGDPLTARDYVFAWKRALLPSQAADYSGLFFYINGAKDFFDYAGRLDRAYLEEALATEAVEDAGYETILGTVMTLSDDPEEAMRRAGSMTDNQQYLFEIKHHLLNDRFASTVGLSVIDDQTLEVRLASPTAFFPQLVAFAAFAPQHRESVTDSAEANLDTGHWDVDPNYYFDPDRLKTNGAFRLADYTIQQSLTLEKSPYYRRYDQIALDRIVMYMNTDDQNALLQYRQGEIDWIPAISSGSELAPVLKDQAQAGERNDVHLQPAAGLYYYSFNCLPEVDGRSNPLADLRVRRALGMTIDRETIVNQVTRLNEQTLRSFVPPGAIPAYDPPRDAGLTYDPEAARALLAEAGYPDGEGFPQISILINNEGNHQRIAERIRRDWQNHLGIDVRIEALERNSFSDRIKRQKNFFVARSSWFGDYQDPTTWLDMLRSFDGNNDRSYNNPQYDKMIAEAALMLDNDARLAKLREAEALMLAEAPVVPIYQYLNISLFNPDRVHNLPTNPWNVIRIEDIVLGEAPANAESATEAGPDTAGDGDTP